LIPLYLPPEQRYKRQNVFILSVIPGPSNPINMNSFFKPYFKDLAKLSVGRWIWHQQRQEWILWRGWIHAALGDMLGSAKPNGLTGHQGKRGCRFCKFTGQLFGNHYYFNHKTLDTDGTHRNASSERPAVIDLRNPQFRDQKSYLLDLKALDGLSKTAYKQVSKETGVREITCNEWTV
jgi:hypothetical protein